MHLDIQKATVGGKTYRYVRLVQSVRKPDGKVTHQVIAKLGSLSEQEIENYRVALQASREGRSVVLAEPDAGRIAPVAIDKSLLYLDIAVLLDVWRHHQLPKLFHQLCPNDDAHMFEHVIFSPAAQQCISPGSKLSASRWFPETALPELTGMEPTRRGAGPIQ